MTNRKVENTFFELQNLGTIDEENAKMSTDNNVSELKSKYLMKAPIVSK